MVNHAGSPQFLLVLLFENHANSLQVATSLRDKEMQVEVVTTAADLIKLITSRKVDLVGISVNHSSSASLVQVLKGRTSVDVLVFGEDLSPPTSKAVLKTAADYQVLGAVSSYNIWMKIGHLVKEKQRNQLKNGKSKLGRMAAEDESPVIVKSSFKSKMDNMSSIKNQVEVIKSNKPVEVIGVEVKKQLAIKPLIENKKNKKILGKKPIKSEINEDGHQDSLEDAFGMEELSESIDSLVDASTTLGSLRPKERELSRELIHKEYPFDKKSSSNVIHLESYVKPQRELTEEELLEEEIEEIESLFFEVPENRKGLGTAVMHGEIQEVGAIQINPEKESKNIDSVENNQSTEVDLGEVAALEAALFSPEQFQESEDLLSNEMIAKIENEEGAQDHQEDSNATQESESSYDTEADKIVSIEAARLKRKQRKEKKQAEAVITATSDSGDVRFTEVFRDAVGKAGESRFKKTDNHKAIGQVRKISLIPVENQNQRGFLIVANNQNQFSTQEELGQFKYTLENEMKNLGSEGLELGDVFNIETQEVDVTSWAAESSQFFHTFEETESKKQVIICFLKKEHLFPATRKVDHHDMHRIDLDVLPPKIPIDFDAYLFLERNEKMLPYLRRGGSLTGNQIDRLYEKGFKFLYIKEVAIKEYYAFYLSQYFNQDFRLEKKLA